MRPRLPRAESAEERVFALALALVALYLVVDAVGRGTAWSSVAELVLAIVVAPALYVLHQRRGRVTRTLVAGALGASALSFGLVVPVTRAVLEGPRSGDVTGALAAFAGLVLLGLAFRLGLRGVRRRWLPAAAVVAYVLLQWVVAPSVQAGLASHAAHDASATAASLGLAGARDVAFATRDGVLLRAWLVPGRNGAAVVVLHGSHGTRADAELHVLLLARAGYAVLAFDARGHGESDGQTNAFGWAGADDLAAAVAFLRVQGIAAGRIAALGLSMGAEEALRAAAAGVPLAAVVADGAGASTLGDARIVSHGVTQPVFVSSTWVTMRAAELATGAEEPRPLQDVVGAIHVPVLLVAAGSGDEAAIDDVYAARIAGATLWSVPEAGHTKALVARPHEYAWRVTDFLAVALGS